MSAAAASGGRGGSVAGSARSVAANDTIIIDITVFYGRRLAWFPDWPRVEYQLHRIRPVDAQRLRTATREQMIARCQEERALRKHEKRLMQAKTAVGWHVRPPSEAESALEEDFSVVKEDFPVVKEEILLLVSCKPTVLERNCAHEEHISLPVERKDALAEANCLSLFPKLLYRLHGRHTRSDR